MKKIFIPLLLLCAHQLSAQSCYNTFKNEGLDLMRQQDYANAINRFWAAMITCTDGPKNNDVSDLIKKAQNLWVSDLEGAVQREKKAYQEAVEARKTAEDALKVAEAAKSAEEIARKEAEVNERLAKEKGQRAEALRLSLLSEVIRQQGKKSDALLMSYMAMELTVADLGPLVKKAFGEAVCDSFTKAVYTNPSPLVHAQYFNRGEHLLLQGEDKTVVVLRTGQTTPVLIPDLEIAGFTASEQTPWLLSWRAEPRAKLWHADGTPGATLEGHTEAIRSAAFSPDGSKIVTASRDNTARIWDLQGKQLAVMGHRSNVYQAQFSSDSRMVLTRSSDGVAGLWDLSGKLIAMIAKENNYLYDAKLSPDGKSLVVQFADGSVDLYDTNGRFLKQLYTRMTAGGSCGITFAGPESQIVLSTPEPKIRRYSIQGAPLAVSDVPAPVQGLVSDAAGKTLASWSGDRFIRLWDAQGHLLKEWLGHQAPITSISFSNHYNALLSTSKDGTTKLWDRDGNKLGEWVLGTNSPLPARFMEQGQEMMVVNQGGASISFCPFPEDIYQQFGKQHLLNTNAAESLIRRYNVELFEVLANHKGR